MKNKELITNDWTSKIDFIKKQFFPANASDTDIEYCLNVAKTLDLNPITKQIFFIERKAKINNQWVSKIEPLIGRDGLLNIAHKSGIFVGMKTECRVEDAPFFDGREWKVKKDLIAECSVFVKGKEHAFTASVSFFEYAQKTSSGDFSIFWKEKPITMLKKVAESQALRKAFNISGIYTQEEVDVEYVASEKIEDKRDYAKMFLNYLKNNGLTKEEIRIFCTNNNFNSSDAVQLKNALENEEGLNKLVVDFLNETERQIIENEADKLL